MRESIVLGRIILSGVRFLPKGFRLNQSVRFNSTMNFKEIEGDLFSAPSDTSLAHCVAQDLGMGAGIAVMFKRKFGQVDALRGQNVTVGGVAVLQDEKRYIYYMVTKKSSYDKPTYKDLTNSLEAMREHMKSNNAKKLALPRIGCGIDGLEWDKVREIIKVVFEKEPVDITVYNFVPK